MIDIYQRWRQDYEQNRHQDYEQNQQVRVWYCYASAALGVFHQDTNTRFVDRCQSGHMMSSSTGYRRWSGVVCCRNSGKPSSPYCGCSTIFWSVPTGHSNVFSWYPSWQHIHAHYRVSTSGCATVHAAWLYLWNGCRFKWNTRSELPEVSR